MYAGTTIRTKSGRALGVHQRIDRVARRYMKPYLAGAYFPSANEILHFEGLNGPDGVKRKSPGVDEPWHFVNPEDPNDTALMRTVIEHHHNLVQALRAKDEVRAAFEAAWLAHALTDGLTPAHHYPLGEKIEELWGKPHDERLSFRDKNLIFGTSKRDTIKKNWEYWGAKGVFSTHFLFEWGVATSISTMRFSDHIPTEQWLEKARTDGIETVFKDALEQVHQLDMYHTYWQKGWTRQLASQTRQTLLPIIIRTVMSAWYDAVKEAEAA